MSEKLKTHEEYLSISSAAAYLGISQATLRNWIRSKLIPATKITHSIDIKFSDLKTLKIKIENGQSPRLKSRANKKYNHSRHPHSELLISKENKKTIDFLLGEFHLDIKDFLFCAYLVILQKKKIKIDNKLSLELSEWKTSSLRSSHQRLILRLQQLEVDFNESVLSYLYQSLCLVSHKNQLGAYYTSLNLVNRVIKSTLNQQDDFLDPCCGSGHFVVSAYNNLKDLGAKKPHEKVYGIDIDPLAVLVARANLTLATLGLADSVKQIVCADALLSFPFKKKFSVICTNPPWGARFSRLDLLTLKSMFPEITSGESFSYFLSLSLNNLKTNGKISMILPESITNVKIHQDIRNFLIEKSAIISVDILDEKFSGVFTHALLLKITSEKLAPQTFSLNQESFDYDFLSKNTNGWPLRIKPIDLKILDLIESGNKIYLKDNARWALGIVTGDNKRFLSAKPKAGYEKIITGKEIQRFRYKEPKEWINFKKNELQQVAPEDLYRAPEKIIYRFICNELVFAIDRSGSLTLNSANVLIPTISGYSAKTICAILNSKVAQFYFQKKFGSVKILRKHLEMIPIVQLSSNAIKKVEAMADSLENQFDNKTYNQLNDFLMEHYNIPNDYRDKIKNFKMSESF